MSVSPHSERTEAQWRESMEQNFQSLHKLVEEQHKMSDDIMKRQEAEINHVQDLESKLTESKEENKKIKRSLKAAEDALEGEKEENERLKESMKRQKKMAEDVQRENEAEIEMMDDLVKKQKKELEAQKERDQELKELQESMEEQRVNDQQEIQRKNRLIQRLLIKHGEALQAQNDRWRRVHRKLNHNKNDNKSANIPTVQTITVLKGLNLPKMDLFGKTDAYVTVKIGGQKFKTNVISTKQDAEWNETFGVNVDSKSFDQIVFGIYDQDKFSDDDLIAEVVLGKEELNKGQKTYHFPLVNSKGKAIQKKDGEQAMLEVAVECSEN